MRLVLILAALAALPAAAQAQYHPVEYTAADGARVIDSGTGCPTGSPGTNPALGWKWGLDLDLRGWSFTLCAESGQTLSATGEIGACVYRQSPQGPGVWASSPLSWDLADRADASGKRCITFYDYLPIIGYGRVYVYPTGAVGVSGGTKVTVYMHGEKPR